MARGRPRAVAKLPPLDTQSLLPAARQVPSPNCDERPAGTRVELIVVHAISLPPEQFGGPEIEQLFTNTLDPDAHPYFAGIRDLRVSSHFVIRRDGELIQFVPCDKRAWHAGRSTWRGRERCNDFSVGIELEGSDCQPFEAAQYRVLAALIARLCERYPVSPSAGIVGHSDIAPGRKTDPGPHFDWPRLRQLLSRQSV